MTNKTWTKKELIAYILLYVANADLKESKKERDYILSRVDIKTYQHIKDEFERDNDYQCITKIVDAVKSERYYNADPVGLFADIKLMAFADGNMDQIELAIYNNLKKILT
ncbi:MAG: hypothetical protein WA775_12520 [Psychroserpens sp.]|uniref:hypothetical protein n=1 Tax=Psychroserpens sp. TaxID=2020870 RepID=UPI003C78BDE9